MIQQAIPTTTVVAAPVMLNEAPITTGTIQGAPTIIGTQTVVQPLAELTRGEAQIVNTSMFTAPQLPTQIVQGAVVQGETSVVQGSVSTREVQKQVMVPQIQTVEKIVEVPEIQEVVREEIVLVPQEVQKMVPVPQIQTVEKIIEV